MNFPSHFVLYFVLILIGKCEVIQVDEDYIVECAAAKRENQRIKKLLCSEQVQNDDLVQDIEPSFTPLTKYLPTVVTTAMTSTKVKTLEIKFGNRPVKTTITQEHVELRTITSSIAQIESVAPQPKKENNPETMRMEFCSKLI